MGNNQCCCPCKRAHNKHIHLLLIGLDNAGKSSTVNFLAGKYSQEVLKTIGFRAINLYQRGTPVTVYDVGGSSEVRGIWPLYYADVHGVIFVIDAADRARFEECSRVLDDVLSHRLISGKPILILANKQDLPGAVDDLDIVELLNIEATVNRCKCPTRVEAYTANIPIEKNRKRRKIDPGLNTGYFWLLNYIIHKYDVLNMRVQNDVISEREKSKRGDLNKNIVSDHSSISEERSSGNVIFVKEANENCDVSDSEDVKLSPLFGVKNNFNNHHTKEIQLETRKEMRKLSPIIRQRVITSNSSSEQGSIDSTQRYNSGHSRIAELFLTSSNNISETQGNKLILPPIPNQSILDDELNKEIGVNEPNQNCDYHSKNVTNSAGEQSEHASRPLSMKSMHIFVKSVLALENQGLIWLKGDKEIFL